MAEPTIDLAREIIQLVWWTARQVTGRFYFKKFGVQRDGNYVQSIAYTGGVG